MSKVNNHHNLNLLTIKNDINTHIDVIKASINSDINSINTNFKDLFRRIPIYSQKIMNLNKNIQKLKKKWKIKEKFHSD